MAITGMNIAGKTILKTVFARSPAIEVEHQGTFVLVHVGSYIEINTIAHKATDIPSMCLYLFAIHFKRDQVFN